MRQEQKHGHMLEMVTSGDAEWLLAAAMLAQIAEDLAVMMKAGWWSSHPDEMRGRNAVADNLLSEFHNGSVQRLFDVVTAGTQGRVAASMGWLLRMARRTSVKSDMDYKSIERRMQTMPTTRHWTRAAGIDLTCMPKGAAAYQAERRRRILEAGYCMCGQRLDETGTTYCKACQRQKAAKGTGVPRCKRSEVMIPTGAVPLKKWINEQATMRQVTPRTIWIRMYRGLLPKPEMLRVNSKVVYVLPAKEVAA